MTTAAPFQIVNNSAAPLPPLTQSMYETMACPASYQAQHVFGIQSLPNPLGELGKEEHDLMLQYVAYLREHNSEADWAFFGDLLRTASPEAQTILRGLIGNITFDPRAILTTEIRFEYPDTSGKPDLVTLETPHDATIWDYKNYFDIIEANTFQSKLYPLLLFRHNPNIETVRFVLLFLRYGKTRDVTYTRDHVPYLEDALANARAKQQQIHETTGLAQAIPGKACDYCPLLGTRRCQVNEWNPRATMNEKDHVLYAIYLRAALRLQMGILRDLTRYRAISALDNNGNVYTASYELHEKRTLPLHPTLQVLQKHFTATGEDLSVKANVSRTSLAGLRHAKKRAALDKDLRTIEAVRDGTAFGITRSNPDLPDDSNYDDDET
jgi:PD-(D/E)XK nuclease superfamily